jgi:hypothetical protein
MPQLSGRLPWARWGIALSIALNLFFAAFIGAQAWRLQQPEYPHSILARGLATGQVTQDLLRLLAKRLPPADARILQDAFAARMQEITAIQQAASEAMQQVRIDIGRQPFDPDRLRADLLAARATRQKISPIVEAILLDALPRMSNDGRLALSRHHVLQE